MRSSPQLCVGGLLPCLKRKAVRGWGERGGDLCVPVETECGRRRTRLRDCSVAAAANFPRPVAAASLRFARSSARWRSLQLQRVQIEQKRGRNRDDLFPISSSSEEGREKNWLWSFDDCDIAALIQGVLGEEEGDDRAAVREARVSLDGLKMLESEQTGWHQRRARIAGRGSDTELQLVAVLCRLSDSARG
ncbi:hypothetical protein L1887_58095 [Cichorium endivia]|nr:hypothetical protein L1887_58095 [Cichorium endivia]